MGLFDSLRAKLKGVSKKLETEVGRSLGDQLEQELAAAVQKEQAKAAPPVAAPSPAPVGPPVMPAAAPQVPGVPAQAPAPAAASPAAPEPTLPAAPVEPAAPAPAPHVPVPGPALPVPQTAPTVEPAPAPAPVVQATPVQPTPQAHAPVVSPAPVVSAPQPVPVPPVAAPVKPAPPQPKPQQPVGKKLLSEDEIAARLERELMEAVEVQKVVEKTVQAEAPKAAVAKFTINEEVLEEILWELEIGLLESDVALPVIEAIKANVKEQLLTMSVAGRPHEVVEKVLRNAIQRVLQVSPLDFDAFVRQRMAAKKPVVIMFVGVNGTGKTTTIGRIAHRLKTQGISSVMAAGDTFRAGAIEQLSLHGERLGIVVVKHKAGADPAAVAYDAIEHAKARHKDVVLLDTAGRMQNNSNLMDEMDKIRRVANPDLCIFVGDSLAGNDAVEQARKFDEVVDVGGVVLTKVDVDAKGGAALSVAYTINKPLLFVGVGQNYEDLRPFDAKWMVDRLFGDEGAASAVA